MLWYQKLKSDSALKLIGYMLLKTQISKNRVDQYPTALIKTPGGEIQIKCNHSNSDFNMIQWYKQSPGKTDMVLLGYARFSSPVVEDEFRGIYDSVDNAVYFCACFSTVETH
uniref:Immunoglobulin V-set domain-containing protein n=1 Tax=Amphiprion ocellaris TaxID=80972 RepID=A0A3Q1BRF1_AMPOC